MRGRESGRRKTCFSAGREAHIHYFEDIHQGALQSDRLMLLGTGLGTTPLGVLDEVVVGIGWAVRGSISEGRACC